ncbi:MAG: HAD family hydrolase [SAR324 cluster bacterium]|jgi:phosphoglycolate phosphatase|nr:HAD family hydrolase [SAR324 cluster bacterium]MCH2264908.1 HAD family hydrolase [SAR324 cluster bacterium]HBL56209.1 HAD family hydrolase [Deltaproteobacteria bacterium]|tara:strand:- start:342 stop:995 length:654 start_codon:yes stop_codon:yes gene_type:complete
MQFKAVCFDLDGTLLDSLADLADCTNKILLKRGFPEHPVDAFRYFVGDGAKMLMTRVLPEEVRNESLIEDCRQDFETSYRECWNEQTIPYKDIPELLDALIGRQLKLTVLSNKPNEFTLLMVENLLAQWNFEVVLGQREGIPRKPDPAGMLEICQQLEIPAEAFLYLGDTATDMKTAVSAGCFPVGVLWGFRTEEELRDNGARAIVKEPLDVLDFLI